MAKTITFKRVLERKDFLQAKRAMFLYRNRLVLPVLVILVGVGVYTLVQAAGSGAVTGIFTGLLLTVALPVSFFFVYRKNVTEQGKNSDFVEETVITIDTGYITARVAGEEAKQLMVSQLKKSVETRRFFFLFSGPKSAVILTKKDMKEEDIAFLTRILQKQIGADAKRFPV